MEGKFDMKLIPEYDGSVAQSVVEWLEKLELVCKLQGVSGEVASVIPLRLTGDAFAVYMQLAESDRKSAEKVKKALLATFAADPYLAYDQFVNRRLRAGESPDVYLAELRRLATVFGGMNEKTLACAFVSGLPEEVRQLLKAGSSIEALDLDQILTRARAVIKDDTALVTTETSLCATVRHGIWQVQWFKKWIADGWLLPYDESKYGSAKGLIPLMAVIQENKGKVLSMMDFREHTHRSLHGRQ
ncbi:hypothetical protein O3P69_004638 [Scylla paramamosain]|uniref:Uncharacterized protein n=1 Tax=Scylla paramamosain TaxID=85552 RepID=A0AAW0UBK6_SCYPA